MRRSMGWGLLLAVAGTCCAWQARAQTFDYSIYVDSDNSTATGCAENGFSGAERRLRVTVGAGLAPGIVAATQSACNGGTFGAGSALGGGAALGFDNGTTGSDVIELAAAESSLRNGPAAMRVGVVATSASGIDSLVATSGGSVIQFGQRFVPVPAIGVPLLALLVLFILFLGTRKGRHWQAMAILLLIGGTAWAAQFMVDGQVVDWAGRSPNAIDAAGDASSGEDQIDLRALFATIQNGNVYFRIDVTDLQSDPPTAGAASAATLEDTSVNINLAGSDPLGGSLSFVVATPPAHGSLGAIASTGADTAGVVYTPDADANGTDSFTYTVDNGMAVSAPATVSIVITPVNDVPSFAAQNPPAASEDAGPQSAVVATAILAGPATAADEATQALDFEILANDNPALFVVPPVISPAGVLGYTSAVNANGVANLQVVLHDDGGTADGGVDTSAAQTIIVTVSAVDNVPVVGAGGSLTYTENDPATVIDAGIALGDVDSPMLAGATVRLAAGYQDGADVLGFTDSAAITGSFDAATGTLTLAGSAGVADYQAALRSVTYVNASDDPATDPRTVSWTASDGSGSSAAATSSITVIAVNDAPAITTTSGALDYSEGDPASAIDAGVVVTDPDSTVLAGATVTISGDFHPGEDVLGFTGTAAITGSFDASTGTLTLAGGASAADYQAALRSITYLNTSQNPAAGMRTVSWQASDGSDAGNVATRPINVMAVATAPVVVAGHVLAWSEGDAAAPIDPAVIVTDPDSVQLQGATITISANYQSGADVLGFVAAAGISGSFDAGSGSLLLTGAASVADYQAALRSVTYGNTSVSPSEAPRTITFVVRDETSDSAPATGTVQVTSVDDAPVLGSPSQFTYAEDDAPVPVNTQVTVADSDSTQLTGATVTISTGHVAGEDALAFTPVGAITGAFDTASGTLALSGADTLANYQAALRSVTFVNSSQDPAETARQVSFVVNDGTLDSNTLDSTGQVYAVNDAPAVTAGGNASYTEGDAPVVADGGVTVVDVDDDTLAGATVAITGGYASGQDVLAFTSSGSISGGFDVASGMLALNGVDTLANYQAALRSVTYHNGSVDPDTSPRTLSWTVDDGTGASVAATSTVSVVAVNGVPGFAAGSDQSVNEDAGAQVVANWATAIDDGDGGSQTLDFEVSGNSNAALFAAGPAVAADGTLGYTPAADANGSATLTLVLHDDGGGSTDTSAPQTFTITVNAVNDAPVFSVGADPGVLENAGPQAIAGWATGISAGPADEAGQSVGFEVVSVSDPGLFSNGPAVAADGTLSFTPAADRSGTATVTVRAKDDGGTANGGVDTSATQSFGITVLFVNSAPSFVSGGDVTVDEDSGPYSAIWAGTLDDGDPDVTQALNFSIDSNDNTALFASQPAISTAGVLGFTPAANASGVAHLTITLHDDGGTANGGVDSSAQASLTITVNPVNDAPVAAAHAVSTHSGISVSIGATDGDKLKDGATDVDNTGAELAVSPTFANITPTGATITLDDAATGTYTYDPPAGFSGTGSFDYSVCDNGTPVACGTATVTVQVEGPVLWFVDPSAPANGIGRLSSPFNSLASLPATRGNGQDIFMFSGTDPSGLALKDDEQLIGQGASGTSFDALFGITMPANGSLAARPALDGTAPEIDATVTMANRSNVRGVAIVATAATALAAAGKTGLRVSQTSASSTATAVDFSDSTADAAVGVTLTSTTSSAGAYGIRLASLASGNFIFGSGSLSGNTTSGFDASNVAATVSYGGSIGSSGTARPVNIAGSSGKFTFAGAIDGSGNGIRLVGNGSGTISFGGRLTLATGANTAFAATAGGTVSATAVDSTLATDVAAALIIDGVQIGASGLHFRSISAGTATAGPANGIVLNNTGSAGGLSVHGAGSPASAGSGGTIRKTTGAGVLLASTASPGFHGLSILDTGGSGVSGSGVTGFLFDHGLIDGNGDSNIAFNLAPGGTESNAAGSFTVTGSVLRNALWHGIAILNYSGTLDDLVITGNDFTSATSLTGSKGTAITVQALGSATTSASITKGTISDNTIANFPGDGGILIHGGNANQAGPANRIGMPGSSTDVLAIKGNLIHGSSPANRMNTNAISAIVHGKGQGNFDISGNGTAAAPLANTTGTVILIGANGPATTTFSVTGNVIEAHNAFSSNGIGGGAGSLFSGADVNTMKVTVSGNTIGQTDGNGILLKASGGTSTLRAIVKNNTVSAPVASYEEGIRVDSGNVNSVDETVCLDIFGNTTAGSTGGGVTTPGIGLRKQGMDPDVNAFGIAGMSATTSPGVENFVNSQNTSASGTFGVGGTDLISAQSGFVNCTMP